MPVKPSLLTTFFVLIIAFALSLADGVESRPLGDYPSLDEVYGEIKTLASENPALVSVTGYGKSVEGRDLVAFRIGQYYSFAGRERTTSNSSGNINNTNKANGNINTNKANMSETTKQVLPDTKKVEPTMTTGSNVIVLVEYSRRADLVPVQKHFAQFGIDTEIVNWSGKYFLITKDRFESFGPGSEGYKAKQKIIAAGALYKGQAPEGYETFSPHFFKDAYGKKVD